MSGTEQTVAANYPTVPDAEVRAWMQKAEEQKRVVNEAQGTYRNTLKRAKQAGINLKALIATAAAAKQEPDQVRTDMRDQIRYMALRKLPVLPDHLFSGMDLDAMQRRSAVDDDWDANEKGYRAGRAGMKIDDNPYHQTEQSELFVVWRDSWTKGQASLARELGPDVEQIGTARKRRAARQTRIPGTEARQMAPAKAAKAAAKRGPKPAAKRGRKAAATPIRRRRRPANGGDQPSAA
jgi:ribosome modulation factor